MAEAEPPTPDARVDDCGRLTTGAPTPLMLSSAILLCPESVMRLDGNSMRGVYESADQLSLFRRIERAKARSPADIPDPLATSLLSLLPTGSGNHLQNLFARAIAPGTPAARAELIDLGPWAVFDASFEGQDSDETRWSRQFVEVEAASRRADQHLAERNFEAAAAAISHDAMLRQYLTTDAIESLAAATADALALPTRVAGAIEVLLSNVARMDIATCERRQSDESLAWLLQPDLTGRCNPGRQFTRRMVSKLGPGTLEGFLNQAQDDKHPDREFLDLTTLKRWNRGSHFPSVNKVGPLLKSVLRVRCSATQYEVEFERFGSTYRAASRLQKALEIARMIEHWPGRQGSQTGFAYLCGFDSPDMWATARYLFWRGQWLSRTLAH